MQCLSSVIKWPILFPAEMLFKWHNKLWVTSSPPLLFFFLTGSNSVSSESMQVAVRSAAPLGVWCLSSPGGTPTSFSTGRNFKILTPGRSAFKMSSLEGSDSVLEHVRK